MLHKNEHSHNLEDIFSELFEFANISLAKITTKILEEKPTSINRVLMDMEKASGRYYSRMTSSVSQFYYTIDAMPTEKRHEFFLHLGIEAQFFPCNPMKFIMLLFLIDKYKAANQMTLWGEINAIAASNSEDLYLSFKQVDEKFSPIFPRKACQHDNPSSQIPKDEESDEDFDAIGTLLSSQQIIASAHRTLSMMTVSKGPDKKNEYKKPQITVGFGK